MEKTKIEERLLYYKLMKRGYAIPLNKIHRYYRETENSKENPKKQKKRKRNRYEIKWIVNTWRPAQGGEWGDSMDGSMAHTEILKWTTVYSPRAVCRGSQVD